MRQNACPHVVRRSGGYARAMGSAGGRAEDWPRGQSDAQAPGRPVRDQPQRARRPRHADPADPGSYPPPDGDWSSTDVARAAAPPGGLPRGGTAAPGDRPARGGPPSARTGPTPLPPRGGPPRRGTGPSPTQPPRSGPSREGTGPSPTQPPRG